MTTVDKDIVDGSEPLVVDGRLAEAGQALTGARTITLTWETVLWAVLAVSALATRFWNLGARVMSHDESLHVYYSWILSTGGVYAHNPMMHGPSLFELTAFFQAVFGANDFTSRFAPALVGITIVVVVPLLLRPWLGRWGALLCSVFFLVSPYVLYYSRYNRHDIQVIAWALLAVYAILAYLRDRKDSRLMLLSVALALMLSTFEISFIYLAIFASFLAARLLVEFRLDFAAIRRSAAWDVLVVLVTLGALFSAPIALLVLNPLWTRFSGQPFVDLTVLSSYGIEWSKGAAGARLWGLMIVFWVAAAGVGLWWSPRRWPPLVLPFLAITLTLFTTFFTNLPGVGTGFIGSLGYWLSQHDVQRGSQPWYYYFIVFPVYEYLPLLVGGAGVVYFLLRRRFSEAVQQFVLLCAWWAVLIIAGLSIAGEKMPWLSTHLAIPLVLLAAWFAGQLVERLADSGELVSRLKIAAAGLPVVLLFLLTARTSYLVNYVNYDYTTEFIGYAHSAPGVKWTMAEVDRLSRATGQSQAMKVAYDSRVSWPMTWYLRDYPGFFGESPNRGAVDGAAVVMVGPDNWQKVESYLGADYTRYEVIRMWWPMEGYKNLTWQRISGALSDPQMRQAVWNILWSRDYSLYAELTQEALDPPNRWSLEDRMRVYIRKDLAQFGVGPELQASRLSDLEAEEDAYLLQRIDSVPETVLYPSGASLPRNIAAAPDGTLYLADSGSARIVRMDRAGQVLNAWGTRTPDGQIPPSPGTFNEPWGVAVDSGGYVYVADTWNHRIQKFDQDGRFVSEWGAGGLVVEGSDRFWGPRGITVSGGRVYVTDTGNRRVAVFDTQGQFLFDFEGQGDAALDEPVGIAVGGDQRVYVADTWNRRVAVFTLEGKFERAWPVQGWKSTSVDNKPFLAVGPQGQVYLTDPEGYRVLVFDSQGNILAQFGQYGEEEDAFSMPTGISVDVDGRVWVVDATTNRVIVYPPVVP